MVFRIQQFYSLIHIEEDHVRKPLRILQNQPYKRNVQSHCLQTKKELLTADYRLQFDRKQTVISLLQEPYILPKVMVSQFSNTLLGRIEGFECSYIMLFQPRALKTVFLCSNAKKRYNAVLPTLQASTGHTFSYKGHK